MKWLGDLETIKHYNKMMGSDAKRSRSSLIRSINTTPRSPKPNSRTSAGRQVKIDLDFETGLIHLTGNAHLEEAGPFSFFTEVRKAEAGELAPAPGKPLKKKLFAKARKTGQIREFEVKAPYKIPAVWPSWLEAAGAVFATALTIHEICEKLKKDEEVEIWIVIQGTHDVLLAIDTVSNALATTMKWADKDVKWIEHFAEIGEKVKGPAMLLEAVMNLHEGGTIMFVEEKSTAVKAWHDGDMVTGNWEYARGFVLVSSTAVGVGLGVYAAWGAAAAFAAFCTLWASRWPLAVSLPSVSALGSTCIMGLTAR